ncbi:MAG TPA: helix-turn-helix transcriptional regulator [Bacillota bacterium]
MATTFDIGSNVRRLREERGISLSALARKAGVSKAYLSQMENDPAKRPSVEIVHQLAQALHVRLTELIGLEEPGDLPPGLRIFWNEHPELPLEEVRMLAAVAQCTGTTALSATDYWLLHETIRLIRRRRAGRRGAPA